MISWIKKVFIPHKENEHRPCILRAPIIRTIFIIIILIELSLFLLPTLYQLNNAGGLAAVLPAILSNLTNEERQNQNLEVLTENEYLNKAAQMKAEDMALGGYFAHISPEGKSPWYWIEKVGYKYKYAGENLAINFTDSKDVTNAWMNSPTHKANIIKKNYTEVGTGVATGFYKGRETLFVAQLYASPLDSNVKFLTSTNKEIEIKEIKEQHNKNVLGTETKYQENNFSGNINLNKNNKPSFFEKIIFSPRNSMDILLISVFVVIFISLLLNIFIKIRHHHPDLVTNGLVTLVIIIAIFIGNYYFSNKDMVVLDFFESENLN